MKIRKNSKIIKLEKNSQENFPGILRTSGIPRIFRILGFPGIFLKIFCFPEVENPGKKEALFRGKKHGLSVGTRKNLAIDFSQLWHADRKRLPIPDLG